MWCRRLCVLKGLQRVVNASQYVAKPSDLSPVCRGPKTDEEIFTEQEQRREELLDDEGREYRICPQCGNRMYRQGRTWTCSNCGYSYVE